MSKLPDRRRGTACLAFCIFSLNLFSQVKKDSLKIVDYIPTTIQPTIASDPRKISENPETRDSIMTQPKFDYGIKQKPYSTTFRTEPIKPARMIGEPLQKLQRFLVRGGYGTYSTTYGEIFINSMRSKEYSAGFHGRHLASSSTL